MRLKTRVTILAMLCIALLFRSTLAEAQTDLCKMRFPEQSWASVAPEDVGMNA